MSEQSLTGSPDTVELVTFHLGDLWIGIDILEVQEIIRLRGLTVVPHAPDFVRGVINLRGEVITIVDLRRVLGLGNTDLSPETRNVIVRSEEELIGILVDRVGDVVFASDNDIEPAPGNMDGPIAQYVSRVFKTENALLCILDTSSALAAGMVESA